MYRVLHHPVFYKHIHKVHHEWKSPVAAIATYTHPLEHMLIAVISPGTGPLLSGCPLSVHWVWYAWMITHTCNDHSGYHFPLVFSAEHHDYHHAK